MNKKSQGAMEFLMTYGWAILIVFVVFAAIFYLGIFDAKDRLAENAMFPPPISATDFTMYENGTIQIKLRNDIGDLIQILPTNYSGTDECETITSFSADDYSVMPNDMFTLSFTCPDAIGKRVHVYLTFKYNNTMTGITHTHTGYLTMNG